MIAALDLVGARASAQRLDGNHRRIEARASFDAAVRAWRDGDFQRALERFRAAQELSPHPEALYNIARAEERLGHVGAAIEAYESYLVALPQAPDAAEVRRTLAALRAQQAPAVVVPAAAAPVANPPVATPPVATPAVVAPALPTPPVATAPTTYERIVDRRRRGMLGPLSFRIGLIGGFAAPRDRQNLAVGFEGTVFIGRSLTLIGHVLAIDTDGGPQVWTGEAGWTFVGDDFDLAVLAHAGVLTHCDALCRGREGALDQTRVFIGGLTLKVDVFFHPRLSAGLYGRFSWQDLSLLDGDALLSSIGLSVSLHL
jgi:hypothetical protein